MSRIERTDASAPERPRRVTLLGTTTEHTDFDPKAFARAIIRSRKPKTTTADREARLRQAEAKLARH